MKSSSSRGPLRVGFVHPDLGIGGAERLVVDAALGLQEVGHRVVIFTAHHDQDRCFEETRDGTLEIRVCRSFLPTHLGNRLRAPLAITRMAYTACAMSLRSGPFDIVFCDLVSHVIPILRLLCSAKIVFYCHFPDKLLTPPRRFLYGLYRAPIDWLEEKTTGMADRVLVNSRFTAECFRRSFPRLGTVEPEVLYPGVDLARYNQVARENIDSSAVSNERTILSINRYESKKNLGLAVKALASLRDRLSGDIFSQVKLIIAGGYDERLTENRAALTELQALARQLQVEQKVLFLRSISEKERVALLSRCSCVLYTPTDEHFGYGPLEAMAACRPVIAVNRGGPVETLLQGVTGLLCPPHPQAFADALARLLRDPGEVERMGRAGREHVEKNFSRRAFGARLEAILWDVIARDTGKTQQIP